MNIKLKHILLLIILNYVAINAQNGLVRSYYSSGSLESAINYVNDVLDGTSLYFYQDGVLKEERTYSMGILNGWVKTYYENGALKDEFYVKEGKKDGVAREFYNNGGIKIFSIFEDGKLKQTQFIQYDSTLAPPARENIRSLANAREQARKLNEMKNGNNPLPEPVEAIIKGNNKSTPKEIFYSSADEFPRPLGGPSEIFSNLVYPESAKKNKVQGIEIIKAYIDKSGIVVNTEVVKSIGPDCDEAAIEAIKKTKFSPAEINNQPVGCQLLIPVKFKLE